MYKREEKNLYKYVLLKEILKYKHCYLFISPFFILFAIFFIYPIFYSIRISLFSFKGIKPEEFIGFDNYINLFQDALFYRSLANTFIIWIFFISIVILFALIISSLIDTPNLKLGGFYRLAIFIPLGVSTVVVSIVFYMLFQNKGILNYFLGFIKIPSINWLNSYYWSKPAIIIVMLWRWTGYYTILIYAGLQSINKNLYEAARIDGSGTWGIFFKIKIPLLIPVIIFCMIIGTIDVLQQFTEPYLLTKGGPEDSTMTIGLYLYYTAFRFGKIGYAASIGCVLIVFFIIIAIINSRVRKLNEKYK